MKGHTGATGRTRARKDAVVAVTHMLSNDDGGAYTGRLVGPGVVADQLADNDDFTGLADRKGKVAEYLAHGWLEGRLDRDKVGRAWHYRPVDPAADHQHPHPT